MIELISVGDYIKPGEYNIHSRFKDAVNFVNNKSRYKDFICIVNERVKRGPVNMLCKGLNIENVQSLIIFRNKIKLNNFELEISSDKIFDSKIKINSIETINLKKKLSVLKYSLLNQSPKKSLSFILKEKSELLIPISFESMLYNTFLKSIISLFNICGDELINVKEIKKLSGLGLGFTPSGDDFICGLLYGINLCEMIFNKSFQDMKNKIYLCSRNNNPITNTLKKCAYNGLFFEKLKIFCENFISSELYDFEKELSEVIKTGETSGADLCVGLYLSLNHFYVYTG